MCRTVSVTGTSVISSLGVGNQQVWDAMLQQKVVKGHRTYSTEDRHQVTYPVYPIDVKDLIDKWLDSRTIQWLTDEGLIDDYDFILLLIASKLAIQDADLPAKEVSSISLVVAHENLGVNKLIDKILQPSDVERSSVFKSSWESFYNFQEDFYYLQTFPHVFNLSKALNVEGLNFTINNACASGLHGIELAKMMVQTEQSDVVLVVSSDYAHVSEYLWLKSKNFISTSESLQPFDKNRDGSLLGDGAGALILESSSFIKKYNRKNKIKSHVLGSKFKQDNWRMTLPDVTKNSYSDVILGAQSRSGLDSVDLVIPHGAGIPMWDSYESKQISYAYKEKKIPYITALKGYTGHTLGANAVIESIILIQCLTNNVIPSINNHICNDPKIELPLVNKTKEVCLQNAMKAVPAYGGFHAATIFEKPTL